MKLDRLTTRVVLLAISFIAAQTTLCAQDITSNLLLHWQLDETTGTTANDSSGNSNDGSINGNPAWQSSAKVGGGLDFETSDGVDSIDAGNFDVSGTGITVSVWIKPETNGADQRIITKSTSTAVADQYWQLNHEIGSTEFRVKAGGTTDRLIVSTTFTTGAWHHLVGTYDGTTIRLYQDGVEVGSLVHSVGGAVSTNSSVPVTVGDSPGGGRAYDGAMDELRVYERALSVADIEALYQEGWDGMIAHWKLDESSGTTAADSSQSGHDATLIGSQAWTTGKDGGGHESDYADGIDDYFEAPSTAALDNVQESNYTLMAYFKPNSVPPGSGSNNSASYGILIKQGSHLGLHYNSSQQFQIEHVTSGPSYHGVDSGSNTYAPGKFYHVASVVDIDAGTAKLFVDGVLIDTVTFTPGATTYNYGSDPWRLGIASPGSSSWRWPADGVIDDARIYNRALTDAEIAAYQGASLVAHYKLDETSGTTAADSSGHGNDGTYENSPTLGELGVYGDAAKFDGVNDHVDLGTIDVVGSGISLAGWFKAESYDTYSTRIIAKADGNSLSDNYWTLTAYTSGGQNYLGMLLTTDSGGAQFIAATDGALPLNRWTHVAATYDGTTVRLYKNGEEIHSQAVSGNVTAQPTASVWIGGSPSNEKYFDGWIDNVHIYSQALSAAEIAELYGLLGHWKLDENSGTIATDSSGIDNDGTYQGGSAPGANGPFPGNGANAAEFAGSSGDKIALPTMDYNFSDGLTMAVWYNVNAMSGSYTDFFSLSNGSLVDDIWFGLDNAQGLDLFLSDTADGAAFRGLIETTTIATNKWQHAVAVIDAAGNGTLYRNGKVVASGYVGLPGDVARTQNGIGETTFGHTIDGELFDARIYNRPLSSREIAEIYGLVAHWKLDEATGTAAADATGSGYDGTHTGGVTVNASGPYPGEGAVAAEFDGSDDYTDLPDMAVDFSDGFSAACWVKPSTTLGSGEFNAFLDLSNGADVDEIWVGGVGVSGFQLYLTDTDDGSSLRTIEDNTDLEAGKWTHYVATVDSSGNAKLYRNGVLTKSQYTSFPTSVLRTQASLANSPLNDHYSGALQDVRVYNRPLSDQEITELYGLVGHWAFDEAAGSTIADSTLNSNNASFNTGTPAWVDGVYGSALEFDGTNDAATDANFEPPENGAVSMWLRSDGPPASRMRPWGVGSDYEMWQDSDGLISMDLNTDGYQGGFITTEPLYRPSVWYHIVAQYNSDDESYEIYINGDLHKSGISTWDIKKQAANLLTFGTRTGSSQRFSGAIDDFRVYNRWLSVADINDLYGRVAYWKFDETSGSVAVDSTDHGNDGTLVGGPDWTTDGTIDGALDFDSSNAERIDAGTFDVSGSELTLMAWVKSESGFHDGRIIFKSTGNSGSQQGWGLTVAESLQPDFRVRAGGTWDRIDADGNVSNGQWYHLAGTYDGTTMRLYVNGLEVESDEHSAGGAIDQDPAQYVTLGDSPVGNRTFDGMIDDAQVFDRALVPSEVFNAYKGGRPAGIRILQWVETR